MKQLVIWDFDGTIADTATAIVSRLQRTLAAHGYAPVDDTTAKRTIGLPLDDALARIAGIDPRSTATLVATYRQLYEADGVRGVTMFPGVAAVLRASVQCGQVLAIATSKARSGLVATLEHLGITDAFAALVCDDDGLARKPHPAMVQALLDKFACDPMDACVIGDTTFDIEMGQRAGVETVAVAWGNHDAALLAAAAPTRLVFDPAAITDALGIR